MLSCSARLGREVSSPSSHMERQSVTAPGPPTAEIEYRLMISVLAK